MKKLDEMLGRFWARLDGVIFADYPKLDAVLLSNWFIPAILLIVPLLALLLAFVIG